MGGGGGGYKQVGEGGGWGERGGRGENTKRWGRGEVAVARPPTVSTGRLYLCLTSVTRDIFLPFCLRT